MKFTIFIILCFGVLSFVDSVPCKDCDLSEKEERLAARMARPTRPTDLIQDPLEYVRDDGQCGPKYLKHGRTGQCHWQGDYPCCSHDGWCKRASKRDCECRKCFDWRTTQIIWYCGVDFRDEWGAPFRTKNQSEAIRYTHRWYGDDRAMLPMKGYNSMTRYFWHASGGYGASIFDPEYSRFAAKCHNAGPPEEE